MIVRKKIVPPVTPRIIQANPRQRAIRYGLLLLAFVVVAWLGYKAGISQTPAGTEDPATRSQASQQRITGLEKERDALRQQVEELERSVKLANQALASERAGKPSPEQAVTNKRRIPTPPRRPVPLTESAGYVLGLEDIRIGQTAPGNRFRVSFSIINEANNDDRVTGTIWIAVNGMLDRKPVRLSFKRLSPDRRSYVKMGFNRRQNVTEEIVLPDNFRPKNILIEAKPYGEKYTGDSEKINWEPDQ